MPDNEVAKRFVACKHWRWMPGMLVWQQPRSGLRVLTVDGKQPVCSVGRRDGYCLPDITDPATIGCILALVREAWSCKTAHVITVYHDGLIVMQVCGVPGMFCNLYTTEAEALLAALEAAPDA